MYDKVKLWLDGSVSFNVPSLVNQLDDAKEVSHLQHGAHEIRGSLNGLSVCLRDCGLWVEGSLPKFMYGSNLYSLDRKESAEAMQALSDMIGADMSEAKVCSLEFGTNFLLRNEVGQYLNRLADCPRLQRESILGSVYYQGRAKEENRTKVYTFYDKAAEIERKGGTIPDNLQGRNFLRYEIRIKKRLNHFFNDDVTGGKLSDKEFYKRLLAKYKEIYFSINKKSISNKMNKTKIKTVSDAFNAYVGQMIARADKKDVENYLSDLRANGVFRDRVSYLRLKKMFESCEGYMIDGEDELIKELDNEVKNVCSYS